MMFGLGFVSGIAATVILKFLALVIIATRPQNKN